jgi:glutamate racemase
MIVENFGNMKTLSKPASSGAYQGIVLIIDSGLGGVSVVEKIRSLSCVSIIYVADNDFFPYGNRNPETLKRRLKLIIDYFSAQYPIGVVLLGCNTATVSSIDYLRSVLQVPLVGIVPAIKPAAKKTKNGNITLLATPNTASSAYVQELKNKFAPNCNLVIWGSSSLADWIEKKIEGTLDKPSLSSILGDELQQVSRDSDVIVLGCTHYIYAKDEILEILGTEKNVLEPSSAVAKRLISLLEKSESPTLDNTHQLQQTLDLFFFTKPIGMTPSLTRFLQKNGFFQINQTNLGKPVYESV